jgi:outer membrane protein assembly factor BamB
VTPLLLAIFLAVTALQQGGATLMNLTRLWLMAWILTTAGLATADTVNWPGWRGDGSGESHEQNPPLYWSVDAGIVWKTPLPGEGNSSPIVWGDHVFLTASMNGGTNRMVLCLDRNDGHVIWRRDLLAAQAPEAHVKNGYASPTPVTDGESVYAFFDSPGLIALDMDGKPLWTRDLGPFKNSYNMAASPVLCGDLVVQCCDQDQGSFLAAFDRKTGDERWRTPRPKMSRQFATPLMITVDGRPQIVVNGETVIAYNPSDGKEIWSCRGMRPNVTPSAVWDGRLVYAVSGRNGPALAIDPRGAGDVTETHVRMQVSSGGPYVPSPLALPAGLLLPGDDGKLRLIGADGAVRSELRVPGHYSASPTACGDVLYWPSEKGQVAVVRIAGDAKAPKLDLMTINDAGGACMASIAIADRKLFLRTDKALLCIGGADKSAKVDAPELPGTFGELKKLFADHPATDGADAALRIAIVEKLGAMKEAESVSFLQTAALKDPQWDVGEAAAKSLAGIGRPAIPALIALMGAVDWQPYLKTIAAEALGQLEVAEAVPALLKGAGDRNLLVRLPSLQALGRIAAANTAEAGKIMPVLTAALAHSEGTVRKTAVEALARNGGAFAPGAGREALIQKLTGVAKDKNPLVAQAATAALEELQKLPKNTEAVNMSSDVVSPKASAERWLRAGPVRVKFQDGELRYLCVGNREIVRRIYFAVRDERYDTVMPVFSEAVVETSADSFIIRLAAVCSNDVAGFSWTGTIAGTAEGRITFQVSGQADRDFRPPRIGLNVLYGAEALAGQAYELVDEGGKLAAGEFPRLVAAKPLSDRFRTLRFKMADGLQVSVGLADGNFGMEDQRNFGDSSYKAYSGMPFKTMDVKKGEKGAQMLTVDVTGAPAGTDNVKPLRVTIGGVLSGAKLPKLIAVSAKGPPFYEMRGKANGDTTELAWGFNVAMHMPDDDTFMENAPAVADQVKTMKAIAPKAKVRIVPVTFNSPYPRPGPDPRLRGPFGAAWVVRMVKQLANAGVEEGGFDAGAGTIAETVEKMAKFSGSSVLGTVYEGGGIPASVEVLAVETDGKRWIWVVNLTDQTEAVTVAGLGAETAVRIERGGAGEKSSVATVKGELALELLPFEVLRLSLEWR